MTTSPESRGDLSQLLEDLARVPRLPVPEHHFEGLAAGQVVGRFVIEREIGRGGFGVVYAARDPELGRLVALKILRPGIGLSRSDADWIRREAEAVARLNAPNIVTLHDSGRSEHGAYLVFELLEGEGLDARLARGKLDPVEAAQVTRAVATALEHAHAAGVLHRDLKPANVFLCTSGAVKVLDFGIAQLFDRRGGPASGTRGYMAPEQAAGGKEDARTDLYALAVVLLAMLRAGAPEVPESPPTRSASGIERLAYDLTRADPSSRPASARVVLDRLEPILHGWRPGVMGAMAVVAIVLAGLATWTLVDRRGPPEALPGERMTLALAPTRNDSGKAELDHLSGLLQVGLADSPRVRIVAQPLIEAGLRELGADPATARPEDWRTAAGRLGAEVVVYPEASRSDAGFSVTFTGRDAGSGSVRFQSHASAPSLEALPSALDGAVRLLRRGAGERSDDLERTFRPVSDLATPSLAAWQSYSQGMDCLGLITESSRNDSTGRCSEHFRKALEADPSFAMASFESGRLLSIRDRTGSDGRKLMEGALSSNRRLTRRDEALAMAWVDRLDRNDDSALRRYAGIISEDPGDVQALFLAGDLLFHASRHEEASRYFARIAGLGTAFPWAFDHLVESLALSDRQDELARLLDGIVNPTPSQVRPIVRGETWLGRNDRAVDLARRAQETQPGLAGGYLLLDALAAANRMDEADALARSLLAAEPDNAGAYFHRIILASKRGRSREAQALADAPPSEIQGLGPIDLAMIKASLAAGDRRLPRLRAEVRKLSSAPPGHRQIAGIQLALLGEVADVRDVAGLLPKGSEAAAEVEALAAWKDGDVPHAVAILSAMERAHPRPNEMLSPAYLLAEVAREEDPSEALAAAARFRRRVPIGPARGWTYGRSLLVSAEAAWRLGRRDEALQFVEQTERLLEGADAGFPLSMEAARLRKAIESGAPPRKGVHFGPT